MPLQALLTLAITVSVFSLKFAIGFNTDLAHLGYFRRRWGLLLRSLLAVVILVPLIAVALVEWMEPPLAAAAMLLLLSAAPGAPLGPLKAFKAMGDYPYAISLQFWVTLIAVFSLPAWMVFFNDRYSLGISVVPQKVAAQLGLIVLLPLVSGVLARRWFPGWSGRFGRPLVKVANGLMMAFGLTLVVVLYRLWIQTPGLTLLTYTAFILLTLLVGHLLGGPKPEDRTTLGTITSTRNLGIALFVLLQNAEQTETLAKVIPYLVVMMILSAGYGFWRKRVRRSVLSEG